MTGAISGSAFCDPWLGSDSFGNIYLSYLLTGGQTVVARSTNGGATFTGTTTIGSGSTDHPELAIGPGTSAGQQSVWVTFNNNSGSITNRGSTVTSLGGTQSGYSNNDLTPSGGGNFGSIAVGPAGQVVSTFMATSFGDGPSNLPVHRDSDGTGATGPSLVNNTIVTQVGAWRYIPAQPYRSVDTQVHLQYDRSGGANNGRLYMLYTQAANPTTDDLNIVVRRSNDNGTTWSAETQINDDIGTNSQFFGRLAVDQTTGNLAAVWMDARNAGAGNILVEVWGSVSTDGGVTWLPNFKISTGQWDGTADNHGDFNDMGDYMSIDFHDGVLVAAWPDASNSTGDNPNGTGGLDIYYARVTVAPVPEPGVVLLVAAAGLAGVRRVRRRA
jgi:hypothetical protein